VTTFASSFRLSRAVLREEVQGVLGSAWKATFWAVLGITSETKERCARFAQIGSRRPDWKTVDHEDGTESQHKGLLEL
jgi:hypothetical protein